MNTVAKYRSKHRRTVTIADGLEISVRPLSVTDCLALGNIPMAFIEAKGGAEEAAKKADPAFHSQLLRAVMLNCIVGPEDFRVVDKAPQDCAEGEISLSEIAPSDVGIIVNAVVEMSGLSGGAAEVAKPFRS